jgi:hypothetical protein
MSSLLPLVPAPGQDLLYLPVLNFCFKKDIFVCLWWLYREFHCNISIYIIYVLYPELVHPLHSSPF